MQIFQMLILAENSSEALSFYHIQFLMTWGIIHDIDALSTCACESDTRSVFSVLIFCCKVAEFGNMLPNLATLPNFEFSRAGASVWN